MDLQHYQKTDLEFLSIESQDDFILSGKEALEFFLKQEDLEIDMQFFKNNGDFVFKGQNFMAFKNNKIIPYKKLQSGFELLSYLSGISSLTRIFADELEKGQIKERRPKTQILSEGKSFSRFKNFENLSLKHGGATVKSALFEVQESSDIDQLIQKEIKEASVNFSNQNFYKILEDIPPHIKKGVHGEILLEDISHLSQLNIDYIQPHCLKSAPLIEFKISK